MDAKFLQARLDSTGVQIDLYESAATALASGVQSYTLDTGQSRTTVTKIDLADIQKTIEALYNRYATLTARLTGGGSHTARPGW